MQQFLNPFKNSELHDEIESHFSLLSDFTSDQTGFISFTN